VNGGGNRGRVSLFSRMESLLLSRRALASPTICRFIPALPDPGPGVSVRVDTLAQEVGDPVPEQPCKINFSPSFHPNPMSLKVLRPISPTQSVKSQIMRRNFDPGSI
jgi:hypothetical protein